MATPPNRDNNTILDIHSDDAGSQGPFADSERERGLNMLLEAMMILEGDSTNLEQKCASNIAKRASEEKIETSFTRNKLPLQEHCIKQETDIPVTTQITDNQETFFETCKVSKPSQLLSLPHNLHSLKIEGCESLVILPDDLLDGFPILKELELINCSSLKYIPYPTSLTKLSIRKCRDFELLHWLESTKKLSSIQNMFIRNSCDSLITLTLDLFPKLEVLSISNCPNLVSFNVTGVCKGDLALECLEISNCSRLNYFPDEGFHTPKLQFINFSNCANLHKLPNFITSLTSLLALFLHRCPHIESLSNSGLPSSLVLLSIANCDKLTSQKDWGLENLESLSNFNIEGDCLGIESFPEKPLPKTIKSLRISKLKSLRKLDDEGFQQMNALITLKINCCDVLRYLPEQRFPSTLNRLYIRECPLLTPRLSPKTGGKYWRKVAHMSHIEIDDKRVWESRYRY